MNNNHKRTSAFRRGADEDELLAEFDAWDRNVDSIISGNTPTNGHDDDHSNVISSTPHPDYLQGGLQDSLEDEIEEELDANIAELTAIPNTVEDEISQALKIGIAEITTMPEPVEDEISRALDISIAEITSH